MNRIFAPALLAAVAGLITGCTNARVGVGVPEALLYQNTTVPLTANMDRRTGAPLDIPPDLVTGESTAYAIDLSIPMIEWTRPLSVGWGRMDLERALADGNIEQVTYADAQHITILRVFKKVRIIVHGPEAGKDEAIQSPRESSSSRPEA